MSKIIPPRPKQQTGINPTTHNRIYIQTLDDLREVAGEWNTTMLEAQRYLVDLAKNGIVTPAIQAQPTTQENA